MKLVAIDSSGLVAGVAILEDDIILAQYSVDYKKTHSQTLLPMLDEITRMTEFDLHTLDAVAISKGPGSFTGLRIGSATAKGLGLALDVPIIEVETVDALAYQLYGYPQLICPMMDARRAQVYTGLYTFENRGGESVFTVIEKQKAVPVTEILAQVNELDRPVIFLGDGQPVHMDKIRELVKVPYEIAPAHLGRQNAAALAVLAGAYFKEGKTVPAGEHKPEYLRLSQAERERLEKNGRQEGKA